MTEHEYLNVQIWGVYLLEFLQARLAAESMNMFVGGSGVESLRAEMQAGEHSVHADAG